MNNTKTIFKSLLIMIVAISLFTVSCSKDEGGTKTPTNPTQPITITANSITTAFKGLGTITIGKMKFDFTGFNGEANSRTKEGTLNNDGETTLEKATIEKKFNDGLKGKVSGATVDAKVTTTQFPEIASTTAIDITITITPNIGNSFATTLTPYENKNGTVTVTLTLKPEGTKKWNGA